MMHKEIERREKMFDINRNKLSKKIAKTHFVLHDLALYLDTHPKDAQAIKHYEFYKNKLEELHKENERLCGPKMIHGDTWTWINGPWPWEREYNEE